MKEILFCSTPPGYLDFGCLPGVTLTYVRSPRAMLSNPSGVPLVEVEIYRGDVDAEGAEMGRVFCRGE